MAPHRALTIPDVLHEVFKYLATHPWITTPGGELLTSEFPPLQKGGSDDPQASVKDKRRTLAHVARTCKAFAEPASRVLWEVLDGFGPIMSVLKNAQISGGDDKAPDWARFEHVARRVRALFAGKGVCCDGDTLALIRSRYNSGCMLPNLRVLFCGSLPLDVALLRALCASPALVSVTIEGSNDSTLGKRLAVIANTCPAVVHLDVMDYTRLNDDCHRALAQFNNLHAAEFEHIDNALFRHLGTLPNLRRLYGVFSISPLDMLDMGTQGAFPALQELSVQDDGDDNGFLAVLPFISSPSLAVLSIHIDLEFTEEMLVYLDEMCASPALARLRELDLDVRLGYDQWDNEDEPFEGVVFADVLRPLQRLPLPLEALAVRVVFVTSTIAGFSVEDRDLKAIASTWPGLTKLSIAHYIEEDDWPGGPEGIGRPSLGALVDLGERCRKLEVLEVEFDSVDARALGALETRAGACSAPQTALRQVIEGPGHTDFCQTLRVADAAGVAAALRKLFPNVVSGLETIGGGGARGGEDPEGVRYCGWDAGEMKTDMFRLMKALLKLEA